MIIIILEDFGTQSVGSSSSSDSSEQDVNSTDDSDPEASDSDSEASDPEELLHFPDPDEQDDSTAPDLHHDDEENDSAESGTYCDLPSTVQELQHDLKKNYCLPAVAPGTVAEPRALTPSEMFSLKHYVAWKRSNGTVLAYRLHAQVLQSASGIEILSLYSTQKLARSLTDLHPSQVDMCPQSCLAYEGEFAEMETCPYT